MAKVDEEDGNETGEEDAPNAPKTVADHLDDFWQSSSLQGLPRVFTETIRFWKFFWFVLFLLLVAGCIYQMWSIFGNYYAYETSTSVNVGYKHLPFPSITFCNVNPFRHSELLNHPNDIATGTYKALVNGTKISEFLNPIYSTRDDKTSDVLNTMDIISTDEQFEMGHQINPMVQSCKKYIHYRCTFTESLSPEFGSCYTFNSAADKTQNGPFIISHTGVFYGGVDLVLFAEEKEYLREFNQARGFRFDIHPYNTLSNVEQHPIAIGTGEETFIKLKIVDIRRLEPPYGECSNEYAESFEQLYGYKYNVETCNATCREFKIGSNCGCMDMKYAKFYTLEQQRTLPSCMEDQQKADCAGLTWHNEGNCTCPLPCNELRYALEVTSNPWGVADSFDRMVDKLCETEVNSTSPDSNCAWLRSTKKWQRQERLRNNFAKVSIYFDELLYDIITENPTYDWSQFMADFGGNVGLWIGASIFTILEFVELFTKICVSKFCSNKCRKKRRKSNETNVNQEILLKEREAMA